MATFTVANRNVTATPFVSSAFAIPQKAFNEDITIRVQSSNWSNNVGRPLVFTIEQSFDSGQSWNTISRDTFAKGVFAKDGTMPSIALSFDDGTGVARARQFRITLTAPGGTVNAGLVATF